MRVNLRRLDVRMTQQILHRAYIHTILKQMRRKTVPERMAGDPLR